MKYRFSGHESFFCKALWLKKGFDFIDAGNKFTDPDAVIKLGVGKNMVQSIKFWLKSFGLLVDDQLTQIAYYLFDKEDGRDKYVEDINTLWLLHYLLIVTKYASLYNLVFLDFQREKREFDRKHLLSFVKRECDNMEQKNVYNDKTIGKDIGVLLHNYLAPNNPISHEEYSALLIDLGLIKGNGIVFHFNETKEQEIDLLMIMYALIQTANGDNTISYDKLQELSLMFCIPIATFLTILRELNITYPKEVCYTDNSGIRNVQFLKEINPIDILNRYYGKKGKF